jgi:exonuclease VII large subunit
MALYLEPFKAAAGEGAALELKMRLLAGKTPALQKYAHRKQLGEMETDLLTHFANALSEPEKEILRLSRELRNKVLHSDFRAARKKLKELGTQIESAGVRKIDLPEPTVAEATRKLLAAKEGKEGMPISNTPSTEVFGWLFEAGASGDLQKSSDAFKRAAAIIDKLAGAEPT